MRQVPPPVEPDLVRVAPPPGEWRVVRSGGLLPPIGLSKRIGVDQGETRLLGIPIGTFDIAGRSLIYRSWPVRDRLERLPDGSWEGRGLVLGLPFCRFRLERLNEDIAAPGQSGQT
jgi:hypothetical protein